MSQNAAGFLNALGKGDEDEDDVPRRRRKKTAAPAAAPAPEAEAPAAPTVPEQPDPAADLVAPAPTPSQRRAAERRTVVEDDGVASSQDAELATLIQTVQEALLPENRDTPASTEPVHKTSVDLRWTLKQGLADLVTRDKRGPKAELNDALALWLKVKGIDVPKWNG